MALAIILKLTFTMTEIFNKFGESADNGLFAEVFFDVPADLFRIVLMIVGINIF